jgi:predicted acetyltransferase
MSDATLDPIPMDQAQALRNLLELYAHDVSEYVPLELKPNGRFEVPVVDDGWWTSDDRFPFFIRRNDHLAGFALVKRGSRLTGDADVMDMVEFFVVRGARRSHVGTSAAHSLFAKFPGRWEIRVKPTNVPANRYWARVLEAWSQRPFSSTRVTSSGVDWDVFRIDTKGDEGPRAV